MTTDVAGGFAEPRGLHGSPGAPAESAGLQVTRRFTVAGKDPLDDVVYEQRSCTIGNQDGSVVFSMEGAEIPKSWSQLASDILISKYFRKAGLHGDKNRGETSVRQVVRRLAHTVRIEGEKFGGYFATKEDADAFEAELSYMLVHQHGAFNSPVWFNLGLWHEYEIVGQGGNWAWDGSPAIHSPDGELLTPPAVQTRQAYERPQCSACFIQKVDDDLMSIYDLLKSEARLFKYGSGTGSNFSSIRGRQEKLSGGGTSSGLLSFLEVFDRAAGSTKSGGTTRRAAKMVCLDMDHPEIVDFINWKKREEKKAHALIAMGYPSDFNGDAYHTISGQNSNNSVRVTDAFMQAVKSDGKWSTRARTTGDVVETFDAKNLWRQIAEAAWSCADPGVQYDSTINRWHTCPVTGRIEASNPCSEYMFLDDTACNLASINLTKYLKDDGTFDIEGYRHACRVFFMAQEILVDLSSYPTESIARNSHDFRPLGLGYANLGSLLMSWGVPYDSHKGRAVAAGLTAIMCGQAYKTSAEMAASKGPFNGFAKNRQPMLDVMNMHLAAADKIGTQYGGQELRDAAVQDWMDAVDLGTKHGYRNAQATVLAPTGTIGLLMDCDTTGVEPDFALVKFKKLAGGGHFKIVNQTVPAALRHLRYSETQVLDIVAYISGTNSLSTGVHVNRRTLKEKGLTDAEIGKVEAALPSVFDLDSAFAAWIVGEEAYARLGGPADKKLLEHLGFTRAQIDDANAVIVGRMTIEGAPHLQQEHYAIFDCANRCGKTGKRFLAPMSHVHMMAAVQPFLSGAISKCLVGETLVPTNRGLVRLGSLYAGRQAANTFCAVSLRVPTRIGTETATEFYYNGVQPTIRVTLADGRIEQGTSPHKLLVATGTGLEWKQIGAIEPGDWLASKLGSDTWGDDAEIQFAPSPSYGSQHKDVTFPTRMSPRLGLFLGMLTADGHITRENYTVGLTKGDATVLDAFAELTTELFNIASIPSEDPRSHAKGMAIHAKAVIEFLDAIGFTKDQIPDCVLTASRATVLAYMSGIYLDGWVTQSISISQRRVGLTRDLQHVWANLGVHTYFNDNVIDGQNYPVLNVSGGYRKRAAELLVFIERHKAERALALTDGENREKFPFNGVRAQLCQRLRDAHQTQTFRSVMDPRTQFLRMDTMRDPKLRSLIDVDPEVFEYVYTQVASVEDGGLHPVFDLSVPGSHSYVANGVVSHNTVNMPSESTVEEVQAVYEEGWRLGLKAVALYRDGCKASQPLSTGGDKKDEKASTEMLSPMPATSGTQPPQLSLAIAPTGTRIYGERARLPHRRRGFTQEAKIGSHKIYIRTGEYEDGQLGEIFIDMHKEGAAFRSVMNCLAMSVSLGLQYGVPLAKYVDQFTFTRFEPSGPVIGHPHVKFATSLVDYIFRTLGIEYLKRHDLAHVKPEIEEEGPTGMGVSRDQDPSRNPPPQLVGSEARGRPESAMDAQLDGMMGDAPLCDGCGYITVRNGSCYKCMNCGNSMGCS